MAPRHRARPDTARLRAGGPAWVVPVRRLLRAHEMVVTICVCCSPRFLAPNVVPLQPHTQRALNVSGWKSDAMAPLIVMEWSGRRTACRLKGSKPRGASPTTTRRARPLQAIEEFRRYRPPPAYDAQHPRTPTERGRGARQPYRPNATPRRFNSTKIARRLGCGSTRTTGMPSRTAPTGDPRYSFRPFGWYTPGGQRSWLSMWLSRKMPSRFSCAAPSGCMGSMSAPADGFPRRREWIALPARRSSPVSP